MKMHVVEQNYTHCF